MLIDILMLGLNAGACFVLALFGVLVQKGYTAGKAYMGLLSSWIAVTLAALYLLLARLDTAFLWGVIAGVWWAISQKDARMAGIRLNNWGTFKFYFLKALHLLPKAFIENVWSRFRR